MFLTSHEWRQLAWDASGLFVIALPTWTVESGLIRYPLLCVSVAVVSRLGLVGACGALLSAVVFLAWITGLGDHAHGLVVGTWNFMEAVGSIFRHLNSDHVYTNIAQLLVPCAILSLMGLRMIHFASIIIFSFLGYWVGAEVLTVGQGVHIGVSGVVAGVISAAITCLFCYKPRLSWLPFYVSGIFSLYNVIIWCVPVHGISWEGHIGGAFGGVIGVLISFGIMSLEKRRQCERAHVTESEIFQEPSLICPTKDSSLVRDGGSSSGVSQKDAHKQLLELIPDNL